MVNKIMVSRMFLNFSTKVKFGNEASEAGVLSIENVTHLHSRGVHILWSLTNIAQWQYGGNIINVNVCLL